MASEASSNPATATGSPAEQLMKKHAEDAKHKATVEDAEDEDDIAHPPPSKASHTGTDADPTPSTTATASPAPSVSGKQKAQDTPLGSAGPGTPASFDELFPSLGGGPKPRSPAPVAAAWGARKPNAVSSAPSNGIPNGHSANGLPSTPGRGSGPQLMSLPGRYSERIQFAPSQLLPRTQLRKPVPDVLRDINKRSKATVEMKPGPGGIIVFEGRGPVEAVRQALKDVAGQLGSKQSVKIPIPASVRPHIIGRQGTVVQGISQRTGARIQVPKPEESGVPAEEEDDSATIDVSIEGDAVAAEMARREIEAIVNERTSTVNLRLKEIPAEFYPFIAGPHDARVNALEEGRDLKIQVPHYHTWTSQPPPQAPSSNQAPSFTAQEGLPIQLSGDRLAVQQARDEIERQVEQLRQQLTISQLPIFRGQHQFIVGERGHSLHDFLAETGCAVILPPSTDDTELLTVTGPRESIEAGINKVMDLAASMQMASVDIARQHPNAAVGAQAHARSLTRYLQHRHAIQQLEKLYDAHIVLPPADDASSSWELYSRDGKNIIRARSDIMNLVNGHPPQRLLHLNVDPFYHEHLRQKRAEQLLNEFGVQMVIPDEVEEEPDVLLVYEGPSATTSEYQFPKARPSADEVREFERALHLAEEQVLGLTKGYQELTTKQVDVPKKFHDKLRRFVNREQKGVPASEIPVRVAIGEPGSKRSRKTRQTPATPVSETQVLLRGPKDKVDELESKILEFVEQEKIDERERGYTISFDYPQKFANQLIGRRGENIKKYREEFDVEIQVDNGKVEIKGPKAKAEAAKGRIIALAKKLEDEVTHVLKIKSQFHRDLIGTKGSQVNRLQERYNVRVNFPRSASAADEGSPAETGSDAGQRPRGSQAPDEVTIRGPKRGADEAREELLSLLQWTMDNSHTASVSVAQSQISSLIGQGGREMDKLRVETGAQIDVPGARDAVDASGRVEIKIKGTKKQVEEAKQLLEKRAKFFDESISRTLEVDKKHHKALIGGGGANIRNIVVEAGGPDDRRELARMVRFPRQDSDENTIRVEGHKSVVDKIVASIEAIIKERESQIVESVEVAPEKHRLLIGRGGETRRNIESQFRVNVDIPKQSATGSNRSAVKITGQPADVENAKAHILKIVKEQEGETIQIPRHIHHTISDNGQLFRRLRNDHKVTVDHAGEQPPPRPAAGGSTRARINGGALPLITDESQDSSADNVSWEVSDNTVDADQGTIPWVLRGSAENIAKVRGILDKAVEQAQRQSSTGYLILPDPNTYRFVVGPGGSNVNSVRRQTGCKITVPKGQARGEAIEILGSREGVEQAKDLILELVKNAGNGGRS
ncbi:hypothetical protein L228DRAFT_248893 [Xylona heveae TC161]|uniref:K Homology domain-containing protein n=1 Tax=Xylona heveae (strain CBS 132557 / TC161) TaxID=1328760 RepID=A0A165FLR4_XYLHT|nr:hypothetical protein L228DRAFT_248893 [Xylona heveae TC161]KZF21126.1 hypothetical protein L228DRAFT_248893 [Xylona heveae TC161]